MLDWIVGAVYYAATFGLVLASFLQSGEANHPKAAVFLLWAILIILVKRGAVKIAREG